MIHHVYASRSNIGDLLSALGIQQLPGPAEVVEHLCDDPFVPETLAALANTGPGNLVVVGGGGLFMDYFAPFWEGVLPLMARLPFCLWGVGYCDLKREASRPPTALLEDVVRQSQLAIVRDERTRNHLTSCVLPPPVPCPSLAAVARPEAGGWGLFHVDNYTTAGADVYEAMEAHDRAFAEATARPFRKTNNRIEPGSRAALAETLARYADADLVLSSALHGCILAVAMGRKVLAVSGDGEVEAFMEAAGLGDWVLAQEETDVLPRVLARLPDQPDRADFVRRARAANEDVARQVLAAQPREVAP